MVRGLHIDTWPVGSRVGGAFMPSSRWMSCWWLSLIAVSALAACGDEGGKKRTDDWVGVCVDEDMDGYGFQCELGVDCDDADPRLHTGCSSCARPNEGCDCAPDSAPEDCTLPPQLTETGGLQCREGTRYCRDSKWSACEGISTFEVPPPSKHANYNALISQDAGAVSCDVCNPSCYRIDDQLGIILEGGAPGSNTVTGSGGGITLVSGAIDGGTVDAGLLDDGVCMPGVAPDFDCDGIPDDYDPYPQAPPFATDHNTIFMDLAPGTAGSQTFEIQFFLNTADVYFYIDMTGSMGGELANLVNDLTSGTFLPDPNVECADRNLNQMVDADETALKNQGIAGNIACLIRDVKLGAGWFRDIPFALSGSYVAPYDFEMFENRQDITDDVPSVLSALEAFTTRGNYNWPEGGMQGLWALATGEGIYAGWDRPGIPPRVGCPPGTWGYACFRDDAVPIIIHITDAPLQNGPWIYNQGSLAATSSIPAQPAITNAGTTPQQFDNSTDKRDFTDAVLAQMTSGTDGVYHPVSGNETFNTAIDVGVIDDKLVTYTGTTRGMAANIQYSQFATCPGGTSAWNSSDQTSPDAFFTFHVDTPKTLTVSTRGSHFDSTLVVVDANTAANTSFVAGASNGTPATVQDLGTLTPFFRQQITGSMSGFPTQFTRDSLGCLVNNAAADYGTAAIYKFRLSEDMPVRVAAAGNPTSSRIAASLFSSATIPPTNLDLNPTGTPTANTTPTYCTGAPTTLQSNCNNRFGDLNIGDVTGKYYRLVDGDTSQALISADFPKDGFIAAGCTSLPFDNYSEDAVVDFSVSQTTTVRVQSMANNSNLATSFDHVLALISRPATIAPLQYDVSGVSNDTEGTTAVFTNATTGAVESEILEDDVINLQEGAWVQYVGDISSHATPSTSFPGNFYQQAEVGGSATTACNGGLAGGSGAGGLDTYRDVVFKFNVTQTQSYDFDTFPTNPQYGYKTWLSLHKGRVDTRVVKNVVNNSTLDAAGGAAVLSVSEGDIDYRQVILQNGFLNDSTTGQRDRSFAPSVLGTSCGSTTGSATGGRDVVFRFHLDTDASVNVRSIAYNGTAASNGTPSLDTVVAVFRGSVSAGTRVSPATCTNQSGNGYALSNLSLTGGHDYFVVVKEWTYTSSLTVNNSRFGLLIEDTRYTQPFQACAVGNHPNSSTYSKLTQVLTPGTYYLVVKGPASGTNYSYQLNIRKTPAVPPIIVCEHDTVSGTVIDRELTPGNYSVVIRGVKAAHAGAYQLAIRDLGVAPQQLACHNTYSGVPNFIQNLTANDTDGNPIDYYVVARSHSASMTNYSMVIDDTRGGGTLFCNDDNTNAFGYNGEALDDSDYTALFQPGDYAAIVKGFNIAAQGDYQITFGDTALQQNGSFAPKSWMGPDNLGGSNSIRGKLQERGIRVITVASTIGNGSSADKYTVQQSKTLSSATGAVGISNAPLTFNINADGSGMGVSVVEAVNLLAGNLSMDVSVLLKEEPDNPTPNFGFKVEALDIPGDSCDPPENRDGDPQSLPDTHINCRPGATPRFKITITNRPPPNAVPTNPNDPNGGWNMKLQLIGDSTYIVDQIPVYIIPEDVVADPPTEIFAQTGTYEQEAKAIGCMGTESPVWKSLYWNATVPSGTKMTWQLCGGNTDAELASCSWKTAGVVQSGGACANDLDCENGYCDASGVCHYVTGPACNNSTDCGTNGVCITGTCLWTDNPIDIKPALAQGIQGKDRMKVRVVLQSNANRSQAPTIHDWRLDYLCTPQE